MAACSTSSTSQLQSAADTKFEAYRLRTCGPLRHADEIEINRYYSDWTPYMAKALAVQPSGQILEIIAQPKACARDLAVLKIACGTGYWTRFVAPCARSTTATDFSEEMLEVARSQQIANARSLYEDAYSLKSLGRKQFDYRD